MPTGLCGCGVNNQRGFDAALAAAELSTAPRVARMMGASLWAGSRLLSVGYNRWHTHPMSDNKEFNRSLHAEHVALTRRKHYDRVGGRLVLYVARKLADGTMAGSKPCANCIALARLAGVSKIYFYDNNGEPKELTP